MVVSEYGDRAVCVVCGVVGDEMVVVWCVLQQDKYWLSGGFSVVWCGVVVSRIWCQGDGCSVWCGR